MGYEKGSFIPIAKLVNGERFSIVSDYLGTPIQAFDANGEKVWERELTIYGGVRKETGIMNFVAMRYQGQYFDQETGLCYNRFRYYSPETGQYVSQDPIGLAGNNLTLYAYVKNSNKEVDPLGLTPFSLDDIANLGNMNRLQISEMISEKYSNVLDYKGGSPDGRFMQWEYKDSGMTAVRIDPPDKVTLYDHIHLYDVNGNALDINGNIGAVDSPDVHIKIKCN